MYTQNNESTFENLAHKTQEIGSPHIKFIYKKYHDSKLYFSKCSLYQGDILKITINGYMLFIENTLQTCIYMSNMSSGWEEYKLWAIK